MRVWILTSELPQEIAGGIARYVDDWARLLGLSGHEVVVIARTDKACDELIAPGVRLIGVTPRYTYLNEPNPSGFPDAHPAYPYNIFAYWPALSYQMAEEVLGLFQHLSPPDIIETQEYAALPYFLLQRKLTERSPLERTPILVNLHSPSFALARPNHEPRYRFPEYWVGQMEKFCIVAADALVAPTTFPARGIEQMLQRSLDVVTIPHPLMVQRECIPTLAQPGHLVYVGRVQVLKGVLSLVNACGRLWDAGEDFRLTLIGADAEFLPKGTTVCTFLQQRYARWIDAGNLRLAGRLDHAGVLTHMQQAWAVIVPSFWESFSYTCMEAMGVGQVVLASQSGGQAELVATDGVNGFLFDWGTPGDFERKLHTVLSLDQEEHRAIAQRAQKRIRTLCAPEVILRQRLEHYEAVIARYAPRHLFPSVNNPPVNQSMVEPQPLSSPTTGKGEEPGLLSVVIPYYNLGEYLNETLDSILGTAYAPYEVIVVNDGSTELKSLKVLQEIESQKIRCVRICHTENRGLASARNFGAEAARGEFVAFVDADDLVEPDFFPRAVDVLRRYPNVTLVYPWLRYFGESTDIWPTWNAEFPYLLGHNMVAVLAVARRSMFLRLARQQPEMEYNFEDFEAWVALLEAGGIGVGLPHPLARYRIRSGSLYRSTNRNQQLYLYDLITQRHPEVYRQWGVELFNLQNANGPGYRWNHPAVETAEVSEAHVAALEQERSKLAADVQTLGKAWEDQAQFIASQRAYIESLESRCRELMATVSRNGADSLAHSDVVSWRDYELGGRLLSRVRRTWLARQVSRYPRLKEAIKKALER